MTRLADLEVSLLVIDEAHCVSSWGHDFRPDYLQLGAAAARLDNPIIALTATAALPVREEIIQQLRMEKPLVIARGFDRPNLYLEAVHHESAEDKRRAIIDQLPQLPAPGILYVSTRRQAEDYAAGLGGTGLRAKAYHAGLRKRVREDVH